MKNTVFNLKLFSVGFILLTSLSSLANQAIDKATLIKTIAIYLAEGTYQGVSDAGNDCQLVFSQKPGAEVLSMKSTINEYDIRLLFDEEYSDLFSSSYKQNSISILQDFADSSAEVNLERLDGQKIQAVFSEDIAGDLQSLTCVFQK